MAQVDTDARELFRDAFAASGTGDIPTDFWERLIAYEILPGDLLLAAWHLGIPTEAWLGVYHGERPWQPRCPRHKLSEFLNALEATGITQIHVETEAGPQPKKAGRILARLGFTEVEPFYWVRNARPL